MINTNNKKSFVFILFSGLFIRIWLLNHSYIRNWFKNRIEISTPLTSWNRVLEGIYLKNQIGLSSTYEGDLVHELPMMLAFYEIFVKIFSSAYIGYFFVCLDALTAILIYQTARKLIAYLIELESTNRSVDKYTRFLQSASIDEKEMNKFLLSETSFDSEFWSLCCFGGYLLNPFTVSSCVALSTSVVQNLILLLWLYFMISRQKIVSLVFLALHSNITVYSLTLLVPTISFLFQDESFIQTNGKSKYGTKKQLASFVLSYLVLFAGLVVGIFGLNLIMENMNTRFIECTYLFTLKVPDLIPNLGLFWYFFTEMFDHFRTFFTFVFQINAFIYAIPMTVRLRHDPVVDLLLQVSFLSILKSYPNVGETGFYLSLLPVLAYLFPLMRNFLVYSCMILFSTILAPVMYYLWLGSGGGNANFYYAITIVFSVGQVFLLVDILYAHLKRDFIKTNGADVPKNKDGSMALLTLE